jgi:hypothetical protein
LERRQIRNFRAAHRARQIHLQETGARERIDDMWRHPAQLFALVARSYDQWAEVLGRSDNVIVARHELFPGSPTDTSALFR